MLRFHHSGFVVANIDNWEKNILIESKVADLVDPIQNARLALYKQFGQEHFLELIQPLNAEAFTWNALMKFGNHFHHYCYSVDSLAELEQASITHKLIKVTEPLKAVLFDGKRVAFYYSKNKQVVEFLILNDES